MVGKEDEAKSQDEKDNTQNKNKEHKDEDEDEDRYDTPLLIAARNGILEIVNKILKSMPMRIHETTSKFKRNILLAAVESRQPLLVETLRKHKLWYSLILGVDTQENTVLHLAAKQSTYKAWQTSGSFMQMIWDIKWYQVIYY